MRCITEAPVAPAGVVNSVNEDGIEVGQAMVASPDIDVISFTGSSRTGAAIMAAAAPTLKRVGLELGGKAPAVIFDDADLDRAVKELTHGALEHGGPDLRRRRALPRPRPHRRGVRGADHAGLRRVRTGPGSDPASQMGSLIDTDNQKRVMRLIEQAGDEGG
jgi:betaine-aldehyde dehydrogenase